jgi:hypothetical protein
VAGIVTLNLNSAVWAKDGDKINSDSFRMFDITGGNAKTQANNNGNTPANTQANNNGNTPANTQANGNGNTPANTQVNDNGNIQTDSGNYQITSNGVRSCDSTCQKKIDDALNKIHDLF